MFPQTRLRRLRKTAPLRRLVEETHLNASQMIWPCFVVPGTGVKEPIRSLLGQFHYSIDQLVKEIKTPSPLVGEGWGEGTSGILIFGVPDKKDSRASLATQKDSLVAQAVRAIKDVSPQCLVTTDVCLCAYMDHGHCGVVDSKGEIQNDASLELLAEMALQHAQAGADIVAPSDMLDGRVKRIRASLDENGFSETPIMSYAAKYASSFYGPFRDAAHSAPAFGDRKSYQMNPANAREALREMRADIEEGADIIMIKPALPYLDIISRAREAFDVPIAAYQVSGEYAMIKAACAHGWLDEKQAVAESLTAIKRAGADVIITYFAREYAQA